MRLPIPHLVADTLPSRAGIDERSNQTVWLTDVLIDEGTECVIVLRDVRGRIEKCLDDIAYNIRAARPLRRVSLL